MGFELLNSLKLIHHRSHSFLLSKILLFNDFKVFKELDVQSQIKVEIDPFLSLSEDEAWYWDLFKFYK